MPTVAISNDFLDAFSSLPQAQQKKVREFTTKFMADPMSPGINYEKLHLAKDPKVRSVRIDQSYRAIILKPDAGDVFVLVSVDTHDEAITWTKNRQFEINPATGALQVLDVSHVQPLPEQTPKVKAPPGLLANYDDDLLCSFGVPSILLPAVRGVNSQEDLAAIGKHLPDEAAEALFWLSEGIPINEVRQALAKDDLTPNTEPVDVSNIEKALDHPDSKRRFVMVRSQGDLDKMLDAPLEKWRVFLHPSQDRLATGDFKGPVKVLGGAGTGKTVVAMHRARHLARDVFTDPGDRILLTTFNVNLAKNIKQNLETLCREELNRIDVTNVHAWATGFMMSQGVEFTVASRPEINECWEEALQSIGNVGWDEGFLRQEWDRVIQFNGIETEKDYLRVSREGRGKVLGSEQRSSIWKVFETYRNALQARNKVEWTDIIRETRKHFVGNQIDLPYRAAVIDEAQDFHPEEWKLLRSIIPKGPNDLFLVGDAHQRIYDRKVTLGRCGIEVRGRSHKLRVNYRTTEQIRDWAVGRLRGCDIDNLEGGLDDQVGYRSLLSGVKPEHRHFDTLNEAADFINVRVQELTNDLGRALESICLVARTRRIIDTACVPALESSKIPFTILGKEPEPEGGGVRLATMHRVKGLEFPCMILVGINDGIVPYRIASLEGNPTALAEHEVLERSLLFVAATRARETLEIVSWGMPSPFLE